jgi:hypothetical protein
MSLFIEGGRFSWPETVVDKLIELSQIEGLTVVDITGRLNAFIVDSFGEPADLSDKKVRQYMWQNKIEKKKGRDSIWYGDRVTRLKEICATQGLTAEEIAAEMGIKEITKISVLHALDKYGMENCDLCTTDAAERVTRTERLRTLWFANQELPQVARTLSEEWNTTVTAGYLHHVVSNINHAALALEQERVFPHRRLSGSAEAPPRDPPSTRKVKAAGKKMMARTNGAPSSARVSKPRVAREPNGAGKKPSDIAVTLGFKPVGVSILNLGKRMCREIVSPDDAEQLYCGHTTSGPRFSSCDYHRQKYRVADAAPI